MFFLDYETLIVTQMVRNIFNKKLQKNHLDIMFYNYLFIYWANGPLVLGSLLIYHHVWNKIFPMNFLIYYVLVYHKFGYLA